MIECVRQFSMRHRLLLNLNSWRLFVILLSVGQQRSGLSSAPKIVNVCLVHATEIVIPTHAGPGAQQASLLSHRPARVLGFPSVTLVLSFYIWLSHVSL